MTRTNIRRSARRAYHCASGRAVCGLYLLISTACASPAHVNTAARGNPEGATERGDQHGAARGNADGVVRGNPDGAVRATRDVQSSAGSTVTPADMARRDGGRAPYTRADVVFMSGMIGHHAQAVTMARWAPTHGASASLQILAERIAIAQEDELAFMRIWLADRNEVLPKVGASEPHDAHDAHNARDAREMMPGMLTAAELTALDKARGAEFDRLFLTYMIRHHEGALAMVERLLATPGAAQDDEVYRFVADVNVDQDTEIARMTQMLRSMRALP